MTWHACRWIREPKKTIGAGVLRGVLFRPPEPRTIRSDGVFLGAVAGHWGTFWGTWPYPLARGCSAAGTVSVSPSDTGTVWGLTPAHARHAGLVWPQFYPPGSRECAG